MFSQTKTRHEQRNPKMILSIADPENHLRYLEIRGIVERVVVFVRPWHTTHKDG